MQSGSVSEFFKFVEPCDRPLFLQAATILYREAGVRGFYSGYFSTLMRNIPSNALKFMLYEEIKHFILYHSNSADLSTEQHLLAGGLAGLLSSFVTTPMDVGLGPHSASCESFEQAGL